MDTVISPFNSVLPTTELARLQEEVHFLGQFAAAALDAISAHLCVLDRCGEIVAVNAAWRKFYDDNSEPGSDTHHYGVGTNYLGICQSAHDCSADEAGPVAVGVRAVINQEVERFSLEYPCDSPTEQRWFSLVVTPFHGSSGHVVVSHENISQRKRYEGALLHAKEAAEAASHAKSNFLATLSHEIRTPMNGILGMTQLLLSPDLNAQERTDYAQTILHSSQNLLELLNDILDLSKVEAGKVNLERRIFSPCQLLSETHGLYAGSARRKGLSFSIECALDDASAQFWGDPLRLRQILSNLVSNALKFTDSGSVKIRVAPGTDCAVQGGAGEMALRFTVSDTGIGIAADQRERLFIPFSQVDSSITRRFGGTGLGLAIIKHLVGLMGGKLGVDSRPGQGSSFWFDLLFERADPAPKEANQTSSAFSAAKVSSILPSTQKRADAHLWHILVVEDMPINRDLLEIVLGKQGYQVSAVSNGQLAVDWVRQHGAPDLILMDCHMPVMDGLQATRLIRAWEQKMARPQPLPIIALTANAFEADRIRCLAAGMTDFLSKPFYFNDLNTLLTRLLPAADAASVAKTCPPAPAVVPPDGADCAPCAPQEANPINLVLALDRMEGDRVTFLRFATALPAQITDDQAEIQQAGAAGDAAVLRKASHRLKSVLGTLGAERAHSACQALEIAARQQNSAAYPLLIHELEAALAALNPALADLLAHPDKHFSGALGGGISA